MKLEAKMYDVDGNEIEIPAGHSVVIGKEGMCFIKNDEPACQFVCRSPDENDPRYQMAKRLLKE